MRNDSDTVVGSRLLLVLYADISGSTRLFEAHGDVVARDACAACIEVLSEVTVRHGGRVVKTIGDEILAVFDDPAKGVMASTDMQGAVRRASEQGRFCTGELRIKVGLHYGPALEEDDDVVGEAPIIAQQAIKMAKADQVLTTALTLQAVPPMLRSGARFQDRIASSSAGHGLEIVELIWEVSGLTQAASVSLERPRDALERLVVTHRGERHVCDADRPSLSIGRTAGNDVVVATDLTSRHHAEIALRRGRFYITDNSANGTLLVSEDGALVSLRREELRLPGGGRLCMGGTPETNPEGLLDFRCE